MANTVSLALKRLRSENESLLRLTQEQERTIMDLRAQLSVERAIKKSGKKNQAGKPSRASVDEGDFRTTPPKPSRYKYRYREEKLPEKDEGSFNKCKCGAIIPAGSKKCSSCNWLAVLAGGGFRGGSGSRTIRSARGLS